MPSDKEKAILAGFRANTAVQGEFDDPYIELAQLADTSGALVAATILQRAASPTPQFYIGPGKVREIASAVEDEAADIVIFNNELSPLQYRNLEREIGVKVIDRTQLILDIFAMRAQSNEGKIQVELAQLEYLLPRIAGRGIELSRLGGGIGTRGPGETKLETDRRKIRTRISVLKKKLSRIEKNRRVQKNRREKTKIPVVSLVGYTNAGKSTLFNALCNEKTFVEDRLFATLDPLTRRIFIESVGPALIVDTVGFIKDLPVKLVESFKSTLEGVAEADLLLHVVDISDPRHEEQIGTVERIISSLDAAGIPSILVMNKTDLLQAPERAVQMKRRRPDSIPLSAARDSDFSPLKKLMAEKLLAPKTSEVSEP